MTNEQQIEMFKLVLSQTQKDQEALTQRLGDLESEVWTTMGRLQYAFDSIDEMKVRLESLEGKQ